MSLQFPQASSTDDVKRKRKHTKEACESESSKLVKHIKQEKNTEPECSSSNQTSNEQQQQNLDENLLPRLNVSSVFQWDVEALTEPFQVKQEPVSSSDESEDEKVTIKFIIIISVPIGPREF